MATLNERLALLLGYKHYVNPAFPKFCWVCPNSKCIVEVPNWLENWKLLGPLMTEYELNIKHEIEHVEVTRASTAYTFASALASQVFLDQHDNSRDTATRHAVMLTLCKILESLKNVN